MKSIGERFAAAAAHLVMGYEEGEEIVRYGEDARGDDAVAGHLLDFQSLEELGRYLRLDGVEGGADRGGRGGGHQPLGFLASR